MARRTDRTESAIALALLLIFSSSFPLASWAAESIYHTASAHAQSQRSSGRYVKAVLLADVSPAAGVDGVASVPWVRARWTAQDGTKRVAEIPADAGARTGSTVRIWIDHNGHRNASPPTAAAVVAEAVGAGLLIVGAAAVMLEMIRRWARSALNRIRLADWDADWDRIGPQWTRPNR